MCVIQYLERLQVLQRVTELVSVGSVSADLSGICDGRDHSTHSCIVDSTEVEQSNAWHLIIPSNFSIVNHYGISVIAQNCVSINNTLPTLL